MRQHFLFILVVYVVVCQPKAPECHGVHSRHCLQIATFNVAYFPAGKDRLLPPADIAYRMRAMGDLWENQGFDVVGAQEVMDDPLYLQEFTQNYLKGKFAYVLGNSGPPEQKVALFYRTDLIELKEAYDLDKETSFGIIDEREPHWSQNHRRPLYAVLKVRDTDFVFKIIVLHLKSGSQSESCEIRHKQVSDLSHFLDYQDAADIVLGDFNDTLPGMGICVTKDTLALLEKKAKYEFLSWPGRSISPKSVSFLRRPYRSLIDHIYIARELLPFVVSLYSWKSEVINHQNEMISDHQPVVMWLRLKDIPR
ncbi:MAG: endonuclease/exonuclease/phosphatase family protein [Leptospiraceae bacterium]|nr:endonuclease/exonuclease/phosphatase family protein [Leptospiraceae bacterium]MDW8306871.1 endonuclease/exonuclease/phosphatase family protein [Leptospiraceae bacterium]